MSRAFPLSCLFFLSGAAALGLQIVWTKMFAAGLGHEMPSMLAVVSAFLGGMALGGWTLDRRIAAAANPARWYAGLQLVIGGWAMLVTLFIPWLNQGALALIGLAPSFARQALVSFALPFLALLPATLAMGATLPAMDRWLAGLTPDGRCLAQVYALNTAGAVAGSLTAAFLLMPALGFRASALAFAGMNLVCGVAGLFLSLRRRSRERAGGRGNPIRTRRANPSSPRPSPPSDGGEGAKLAVISPESSWCLLPAAFVTGLLGIGFEIVGVRVLSQALENTIYTFAAALAVYLLGTTLGATLYQRFGRVRSFRPTLATLLCGLATVCLAEVWVLSRTLAIYDALRARAGSSLAGVMLAEIGVALLVFGPPTLIMGAMFSHLVQAAKRTDGGVGRASAINTLGGALAGLVFGLALLPALGAKWTLVTLALAYLVLLPLAGTESRAGVPPALRARQRERGVSCADGGRRDACPTLTGGASHGGSRTRLALTLFGVAIPIVLVFLLPKDLRLLRLPPEASVRDYREGVMASVAVLATPDGHRSLRVNNRFQMGGTAAALAQRRQAHLPLLLHPAPGRVLFLGPGTGITLGAARDHPGLVAEGVELVPEVIELMHHFEPENRGPFLVNSGRDRALDDKGAGERGSGGVDAEERAASPTSSPPHSLTASIPRLPPHSPDPAILITSADARRFIRSTRQRYDVIVADLFHPAQDGAGFLYTREHFAAIRARLAGGGLFCQWLPLHQLDEATLRTIVRTFLDVFPQTQAFVLHFNVDIPVLGLIGTLAPLRLSPDAVERRLNDPAVRAAMKSAGLDRTLNLLGCALTGPTQLESFAANAAPNTDDHPRVTFSAPRSTLRPGTRPHEMLLDLLRDWQVEPSDLLGPDSGPFAAQLTDFIAARDLYLRGLATEADGRLPEAIDAYLDSTRRSLYFTPAYARLVNIIQVLAATDRPAARRLFDRLEVAQPAQPLGRQMLGPLLAEP